MCLDLSIATKFEIKLVIWQSEKLGAYDVNEYLLNASSMMKNVFS